MFPNRKTIPLPPKVGSPLVLYFMDDDSIQSTELTLFESLHTTAVVEPDFVNIEKNLTSLGFFTPSSKKIKAAKSKVIQFRWNIEGKWAHASVTIVPAALYGLPITADQDKWLAFQKLITDRRNNGQPIINPIGFTTAELIRTLGKRVETGKNYQDVAEWLDVMTSTTIKSEQAVYFAKRRDHATDRFHVFDRSVSVGRRIDEHTVADRNYVWLSEWQLENINNNYVLPIDFETYKQLKNNISKALVPLLQIWLYATASERVFEKRYSELCQHLNIREYQYLSYIKQTLSPALDELVAYQYLSGWQIEKASDGVSYKIVLRHGEKFYRDRRRRLGKPDLGGTAIPVHSRAIVSQPPPATEEDSAEAKELILLFYRERYGQEQEPSGREILQAKDHLKKGKEWAMYLVRYAAQQGKRGNSFPNDFGGVAKVAASARTEFNTQQKAITQNQIQDARKAHETTYLPVYLEFLWSILEGKTDIVLPESFTVQEEQTYRFYRVRAGRSDASARARQDVEEYYERDQRTRRLHTFARENSSTSIPTFWQWDKQHNPCPFGVK